MEVFKIMINKNLIVQNIPEELKSKSNWVCHRNKVPVSAKGTGNASCNDTSTWCDFDTAVAYAEANNLGLGYQFAVYDGIVGIDIDYCVVDKKIADERIRHILQSSNSYFELSPSLTGVHLYVKGNWDASKYGNKIKIGDGMAIEVYNSSRYFTITGIKPPNIPSEINEAQDVLDYIADNFFADRDIPSNDTAHTYQEQSAQLDAESLGIIEDELANNPSFASFWNGNRPCGDESADDFGLICALLRILDGDKEKARIAFLKSEHVATKNTKQHEKIFVRVDYLERTIEAAANALENGEELSNDYALLQYLDNDSGNAEKFLHIFGENVKYCVREGQWYVYSDHHWHADEDGEIKMWQDQLYERFMIVTRKYDKERQKVAESLGNSGKRSSMLQVAESKCGIHPNEFDKYNYFLSAANGIVDLRCGELVQFNPEYLLRQRTEVRYNPDAPEPTRFLKFIEEIFCGDQALVEYCLRLLGYLITGESREQTFYIFHGSGANGKSVLVNLLRKMFKDITAFLAQDSLLLRNTSTTNPSLYAARFSRLCFINETNRRDALNTALLKALSGGDITAVRTIYKGHVDLEPHFKMVFVTNHLPNVDWSDSAILRRVRVIPFSRIFKRSEQDNNLTEKLYAEREGILNLLVKQAVLYYQQGMPIEPECMEAIINQIRREDDSVYAFFNEVLEQTYENKDRIQARPLFTRYLEYCTKESLCGASEIAFAQKMASYGVDSLKTGGCKNYTGIRYREEDNDNKDSVA